MDRTVLSAMIDHLPTWEEANFSAEWFDWFLALLGAVMDLDRPATTGKGGEPETRDA